MRGRLHGDRYAAERRVSFALRAGCVPSPGDFTCSDTGWPRVWTKTFTVHVTVASSMLPGAPNVHVSVASTGTIDPNSARNARDTDPNLGADLQASISAPGGTQSPAATRCRSRTTASPTTPAATRSTGRCRAASASHWAPRMRDRDRRLRHVRNATGLVAGRPTPNTVHGDGWWLSTAATARPNRARQAARRNGTIDPTAANPDADTSPDVTIITQADLVITGSGDSASATPSLIPSRTPPGLHTNSPSRSRSTTRGGPTGGTPHRGSRPSLSARTWAAPIVLVTLTYSAAGRRRRLPALQRDLQWCRMWRVPYQHRNGQASAATAPSQRAVQHRAGLPRLGARPHCNLTNNARSELGRDRHRAGRFAIAQAVPGRVTRSSRWGAPRPIPAAPARPSASTRSRSRRPRRLADHRTRHRSAGAPYGVNTDCYRLNISPLTNNTNYTIAVLVWTIAADALIDGMAVALASGLTPSWTSLIFSPVRACTAIV